MANDDELQNDSNCTYADMNHSSALLCEEEVRNDVEEDDGLTSDAAKAAAAVINLETAQSNTTTKFSATTNKRDGNKLEEELQHLNRRIKHIQESIQFSSSTTALSNPQTWQENCLFAVKNCVHEWKSIANFHFPLAIGDEKVDSVSASSKISTNSAQEEGQIKELMQDSDNLRIHEQNETLYDQKISNIALKVFGLMQMSLQVGPLKGSNPAYFKRCGSDVAQMAHQFLTECVGHTTHQNDDIGIYELRFTERQRNIIKKWIKNAAWAAEANKAPSKSSLKLQKSASSKKSQKKKKKKVK